jgi:hypothetical protein
MAGEKLPSLPPMSLRYQHQMEAGVYFRAAMYDDENNRVEARYKRVRIRDDS